MILEIFKNILNIVKSKKFIIILIPIIIVLALKNSLTLPASKLVEWETEKGSSWKVGGVDVYLAEAEELIELSNIKYGRKFGEVPNEEGAYKIAVKLLNEMFGDSFKNEMPFKVYYNQNAGSWIVRGTPFEGNIGCGVVAINKSTGEIYLLRRDI